MQKLHCTFQNVSVSACDHLTVSDEINKSKSSSYIFKLRINSVPDERLNSFCSCSWP